MRLIFQNQTAPGDSLASKEAGFFSGSSNPHFYEWAINLGKTKVLCLQKFGTVGGAEIDLFRIIRSFGESFSFSIIGEGKGKFFDMVRKEGVNVVPFDLPDWRKGKNLLSRYLRRKQLESVIKNETNQEYSILYVNDFFYAPYGVSLGRALGIPVIVHIRSDCDPKRIVQYHLDRASILIAPTNVLSERLSAAIKTGTRVLYIPHGVPSPSLTSSPPDKTIALPVRFGVVANLLEHKGFDTLLKACSLLKGLPGWKLKWIGGDPKGIRPMLEKRVEEELISDRIGFLPFQEDLSLFYQGMDCLVHPSLFEPFGLSMIEALSYGVPVISGDTVGGKEIFGDGKAGWLFPIHEYKILAAIMKMIITDPGLLQSKSHEALTKYAERFHWDHYIKEMRFAFELCMTQ